MLLSICHVCSSWISILALSMIASVSAAETMKRSHHKTPHMQSFKSTNVTAPILKIEKSGQELAPGLLVFAQEISYPTALLMTDDGELVWSGPVEEVNNPTVQMLHGKPVLSRWIGVTNEDFAYGKISILDMTYSEIHVICPDFGLFVPSAKQPPPCQADSHESFITDRNTLIVTAYNITQADLRPVGGPKNGWVVDGQFYEIDVKTRKILFKWSSLEHVPLKKTVVGLHGSGSHKGSPFDYFHINSVQTLGQGYLVNSRHTSGMYHVGPSGRVIWEFNGRDGGDFGPVPDKGHFNYQHDARHTSSDADPNHVKVHIFNNDNYDYVAGKHPSNGLDFHLDTATNSSKLLHRLHDPSKLLYATSQGSYQPLPNGNTLVGYGDVPFIKEFGPQGNMDNTDVRMTISFGGKNAQTGSYRAYRSEWHATPATKPDVATHFKAGKGWVSWNGATEVTSYAIYTGKTKDKLKKTSDVRKRGFETEFALPQGIRKGDFLQVAAFEGQKLARKSRITRVL